MIISCNECTKKFEIDSNLIPETGRLLKCSACNHTWFYTYKNNSKSILPKVSTEIPQNNNKIINQIKVNKEITTDLNQTNDSILDKQETNSIKKINKEKNISVLNLILVFIISVIAFIIIIDTFKHQISTFIPNIYDVLNSLFETLKDIKLFIIDLF